MRVESLTRAAGLALLLGGFACAGNKSNDQVGAARDTTAAARSDTTKDQTQSGVTDSSGKSTMGKGVEKTRPDQGQPVTSKGDTLNPGVDSSAAGTGTGGNAAPTRETTTDTSSMRSSTDTSRMRSGTDTSSMRSGTDTSSMRMPMDTSSMQHTDSGSTQR